jgi:hypothetical protein
VRFNPGYGLAAIGYMTAIYLLSASRDDVVVPVVMLKLFHLPLFGGLAACLLLGLTRGRWYRAVSWQLYGLVGLVAAAYAAVDEWHQSFVPGRNPSGGDFLLDCMGILLFVALHRTMSRPGAVHEDP